jgi:hypothetical protein
MPGGPAGAVLHLLTPGLQGGPCWAAQRVVGLLPVWWRGCWACWPYGGSAWAGGEHGGDAPPAAHHPGQGVPAQQQCRRDATCWLRCWQWPLLAYVDLGCWSVRGRTSAEVVLFLLASTEVVLFPLASTEVIPCCLYTCWSVRGWYSAGQQAAGALLAGRGGDRIIWSTPPADEAVAADQHQGHSRSAAAAAPAAPVQLGCACLGSEGPGLGACRQCSAGSPSRVPALRRRCTGCPLLLLAICCGKEAT